MNPQTIYDFTVQDAQGTPVSLSEYKGKVLLIVNTATRCGFTPQYAELEALYQTYRDQGFEILDFPCNQFGHQAPGTEQEIAAFCTLKYKTTFRLFKKIEVNGPNAEPLYKWLKAQKSGFLGGAVKWNFTKFLVDRNGQVVERFGSVTSPEKIEEHIRRLLQTPTAE